MDAVGRVIELYRRLTDAYGTPKPAARRPVLDELVFTVLSQNTNDRNRDRAYAALRARFPDWASVAAADPSELAEVVRVAGLGATRARYIQGILQRVFDDRREYSLDFLENLSNEDGLDYLTRLSGVGAKTAHCVLAFALGRNVFPVDTHILRVSKRLGFIPPNTGLTEAHKLWAAMAPDGAAYPLHKNIIRHGREVCRARRPVCNRCVLTDICRSAERFLETSVITG